MINKNKESLFSIISESIKLFYPYKIRQLVILLFITFIGGVIEVLSFTSIIPVIYLINNPAPIENNDILHWVYTQLGFTSYNYFILFLLVILTLTFLGKNLILLGTTFLQNRFIYLVSFYLVNRQLDSFYKQPYSRIKGVNSVEYLRYISTAPELFGANLLMPLITILYEGFVVFCILVALVIYYPMVFLMVFISVVPLSYILIRLVRKRLSGISGQKGKLEIDVYREVMDAVNGYNDIKLFSKEKVFIKTVAKKYDELFRLLVEVQFLQGIPRRIIEIVVILAICILYAITTIGFNIEPMQLVLILLAFATAAYRLMPSINEILFNVIRLKSSRYILDFLNYLMVDAPEGKKESLPFTERLEWENISYRYTDDNVLLKHISVTINRGDFIVITGESGIGKSTIGKIFTGFIHPDEGRYMVDGKQVSDYSQIKHLIAYITQDFYLFDRSLLENIAIGEAPEEIDMERISKVIQSSNLSELVDALPGGVHYNIGQMGSKLSLGQKQRVAIARALYKQAQILILDEITSSLDMENEKEILDTIYGIAEKEGLTVILITHRLSSLSNYDHVYNLENNTLNLVAG